MQKPKWLYSWTWTEADEIRLSGAADDLDSLANELSLLAGSCHTQGKNSISSELITDAGTHYEDEIKLWKDKIDLDVVSNLRASASAIRNTVSERRTIWDQFQLELQRFYAWLKEQPENPED